MATTASGAARPGVSVGPTSEFSLFFRVKAGEGESLRAALSDLQQTPGYRPGDYGMAIKTIHEARFVLFDDDTRLAFITSFDGPWDAYMEDFFTSGPTLALFDVIFRHTEGYDGLPDLAAVKAFILGAQQTAAAYARNYGGTVKEIRKAAARQRGLPARARPPRRRRGAPAPRAGSRCSTKPRTDADVGSHLRPARAGGPDRRHHRRLRVPEPGAAGPSRARDEHAAVRQALQPALGRPAVPVPAAPAHRHRAGRSGAVRGRRAGVRVRHRVLRAHGRGALRAGRHVHDAGRRDRLVPGQRRTRRLRDTACACSPVRAGIRSSSTRRRR